MRRSFAPYLRNELFRNDELDPPGDSVYATSGGGACVDLFIMRGALRVAVLRCIRGDKERTAPDGTRDESRTAAVRCAGFDGPSDRDQDGVRRRRPCEVGGSRGPDRKAYSRVVHAITGACSACRSEVSEASPPRSLDEPLCADQYGILRRLPAVGGFERARDGAGNRPPPDADVRTGAVDARTGAGVPGGRTRDLNECGACGRLGGLQFVRTTSRHCAGENPCSSKMISSFGASVCSHGSGR